MHFSDNQMRNIFFAKVDSQPFPATFPRMRLRLYRDDILFLT